MTAWLRTDDEDGVTLRAGDSWIRIRPRVREVPDVCALVAATLAEAPTSDVVHEPPSTLVTDEGELASVGGARWRELECTVAIVGGGEPSLCIAALGEPGPARTHALALTRELGLGLGALRRRPFLHEPPPAWIRARTYGATVWRPPDVPAIAHVFDARPLLATEADRFERLALLAMGGDFTAIGEARLEEVRSTHGLEGRLRTADGTRGVRMAIACGDDRFLYAAHYEGPGDPAIVDAVRRMFASFRPLPKEPLKLDAFAMWQG